MLTIFCQNFETMQAGQAFQRNGTGNYTGYTSGRKRGSISGAEGNNLSAYGGRQ